MKLFLGGRRIRRYHFCRLGKNLTESDYLQRSQRDISRINKIITENQEAARLQIKEIYDKKSGKAFEVGEQVMLFNPAVKLGESKKFAAHYKGHYVIDRKQGETNCVIKPIKEGLREETVHQNRLKRSFVKVEIKLTPINTMKDTEETLDKPEELMKFLPVTTTDSDDERWEEQIGTACSVPLLGLVKKNRKITN